MQLVVVVAEDQDSNRMSHACYSNDDGFEREQSVAEQWSLLDLPMMHAFDDRKADTQTDLRVPMQTRRALA